MEKILAVNAGSSSLKFSLYIMPEEEKIAGGLFERIGLDKASYTIKYNGSKIIKDAELKDHKDAVEILCQELVNLGIVEDLSDIKSVGHRVVQGADVYDRSVIINEEVKKDIKKFIDLAPLHNGANLIGIKAFENKLDVKHVAVFDTAFHQTMEEVKFLYPIPKKYYDKYKIRKYGFHGTSHKYITEYMKDVLNKEDVNLIICHIGNGASLSCIKNGKCYDTSMGFTPLTGVVMGTRSGDVDASIIPYIMNHEKITVEETLDILNKKSGLLGLSGISNDSRDVEDAIAGGNKEAKLAQEIYIDRVVSYIARYYFDLEAKVDAIIFTAGVGENSKLFREDVLNKLKCVGIIIDKEKNDVRSKFTKITTEESKIQAYIVPTDEEIMIARDTYELTK